MLDENKYFGGEVLVYGFEDKLLPYPVLTNLMTIILTLNSVLTSYRKRKIN